MQNNNQRKGYKVGEVNTNYRKTVSGDKSDRTNKAQDWLNELDSKWSKEVEYAVNNSTFNKATSEAVENILSVELNKKFENTVSKVFCNDVVTCAKASMNYKKKEERVCVLNFASYVNPGGGFLKGSTAQEEALCFATGLYPCLEQFQEEYENHREHTNDSCYSHDYIYSKDVPFIVNGKCYKLDVLTMAAPNQVKAKYSPVEDIFAERMKLAYKIPAMNGCDIVLLGAWGCGVFGNDPKFVATTWKELSEEFNGVYKEVVHPILDSSMAKVFNDIYGFKTSTKPKNINKENNKNNKTNKKSKK